MCTIRSSTLAAQTTLFFASMPAHLRRSQVKTTSYINAPHSNCLFIITVNKFVGHDTNSAYSSYMHASISECGHYLASGSYDGHIYIWSTKLGRSKVENIDETANVYPIARLVGHEKEVTCVQWAFKSNQLMVRFFNALRFIFSGYFLSFYYQN
jgi:WD40 repeat protein